MRKRYSNTETKFVMDVIERMTYREMGEKLNRTRDEIKYLVKRSGICRSDESQKKFQIENGRKNGGYSGKKIKYKRVPCIYPELGPCKICTSHSNGNRYPIVVRKGKRYPLHRQIWEKYHGPIPKGMCVCHDCDSRACVEIAHLFLGPHKDNMHDMARKGRTKNQYNKKIAS